VEKDHRRQGLRCPMNRLAFRSQPFNVGPKIVRLPKNLCDTLTILASETRKLLAQWEARFLARS
jgi:hypothetical protein